MKIERFAILLHLILSGSFVESKGQQKQMLYSDRSDTTQGYYLFYPSTKPNGKAIVVCPGGGYDHVSMNHEGIGAAVWLNEQGFDVYVLHYRVSKKEAVFRHPSQLNDVKQIANTIKATYKEWGIMGFSAGGHLAGMYLTEKKCKADFGILIYPVISTDSLIWHRGSFRSLFGNDYRTKATAAFSIDKRITKKTAPIWIVHCKDDKAVPFQNAVLVYEASKKYQSKTTLQLFEKGGHGFGMRPVNSDTDIWKQQLINWLKQL